MNQETTGRLPPIVQRKIDDAVATAIASIQRQGEKSSIGLRDSLEELESRSREATRTMERLLKQQQECILKLEKQEYGSMSRLAQLDWNLRHALKLLSGETKRDWDRERRGRRVLLALHCGLVLLNVAAIVASKYW